METPEELRLNFMRQEYENLPALIALYGSLQWQKSQWFFAVESLQLGGIGYVFKNTILSGIAPSRSALLLLAAACIFNFWICYVWFRTSRTTRKYLSPLLLRGGEIEAAILKDPKGTFSSQKTYLNSAKYERHSSSAWEVHLPSGIAFVWAAALLASTTYGGHFYLALSILSLFLITLLLVERFHPKRQGRTAPKTHRGAKR